MRVGSDGVCDEAEWHVHVHDVRVGRERVREEDDTADVREAELRADLRIAAERARGTRRAEVRILAEDGAQHLHGRIGAGEAELAQHGRVLLDEILHGGLHVVMRDEGEATHVCRRDLLTHRLVEAAAVDTTLSGERASERDAYAYAFQYVTRERGACERGERDTSTKVACGVVMC
jgi:hypothetical protein